LQISENLRDLRSYQHNQLLQLQTKEQIPNLV